MATPHTERQYRGIQGAFSAWLRDHRASFPAPMDVVAGYLRHVRRVSGPSAVPVHASAVGALYRAAGLAFDTKAPELARVLTRARAAQPRPRVTNLNRLMRFLANLGDPEAGPVELTITPDPGTAAVETVTLELVALPGPPGRYRLYATHRVVKNDG